jgi:hypothetical protein
LPRFSRTFPRVGVHHAEPPGSPARRPNRTCTIDSVVSSWKLGQRTLLLELLLRAGALWNVASIRAAEPRPVVSPPEIVSADRLRIRRDCQTVCGDSRCRVAQPFRLQAAPWSMIQVLREGPDQISRHHASNLYACHGETPFENQSVLTGDRRCCQPQSKKFHELRSKLSGFVSQARRQWRMGSQRSYKNEIRLPSLHAPATRQSKTFLRYLTG